MKSNQKLTLLFWHRKSKADANGYAPVICRISIDGEEEELSISEKVHLKDWDVDHKKAKKNAENKKANLKITQVTADLERHFTLLQSEHTRVSPLMLKNIYQGLPAFHQKGKPKPQTSAILNTLLESADTFVADFAKMVEKNLRSGETLKQWRATRKKIEEFLQAEFSCKDMPLVNIEPSFANRFYNYLTIEREKPLREAAAKKQIKNTKQILTFAEGNNWIVKNPIQRFRCGGDQTDIQPLEIFEVEAIWRKELTLQRLIEVRDAFIFQCFTGFAYQDIYGLTTKHIVQVGLSGERWLIKERGKTNVTEMVPVLPIVEELIDKYKSHPCRILEDRVLPVNSNSRYNGYLKEIAVICGLNRELNTHLARHTFADIMLNVFDFSLEEVSKILGHKSIRTTQRYAKIRKNRISNRMAKVKGILFTDDGQLKQLTL